MTTAGREVGAVSGGRGASGGVLIRRAARGCLRRRGKEERRSVAGHPCDRLRRPTATRTRSTTAPLAWCAIPRTFSPCSGGRCPCPSAFSTTIMATRKGQGAADQRGDGEEEEEEEEEEEKK
jgi:hypothetical protein